MATDTYRVVDGDEIRALNTDLRFILDHYAEAKELVSDLRACHLPADLAQRVEDFWTDTFLDVCTTFGASCNCNAPQDPFPELAYDWWSALIYGGVS